MCCGQVNNKPIPAQKNATSNEGVLNNQRALAAAAQKQKQQSSAQTKWINKKVITNPLIR